MPLPPPPFPVGERVPSSNANTAELVQRLRNYYLIARDNKRGRYDNWQRNYRLVNTRTGGRDPKDSEIYPVLSSLVGWITDQNINIEFVPAADPNTPLFDFYSNIARDLGSVLYTTWLMEGFRQEIKLVLWDTFQYSVGIFKNVWDNSLAGGYGNVALRRVDPWSFYPDPHATSFRDMSYCVEVRRMSLDEIERRWPKSASFIASKGSMDKLDQEKPNLYNAQSRAPMANPGALPGGTGVYGGAKQSYDSHDPMPGYIVYEFWLKENSSYYDDDDDNDADKFVEEKWRVVIMCNGEILMDERAEDLWSHGEHPYERFVFDDLGEFYGMSLVDHLASPQMSINRLLGKLHTHADLVGDPILVESAGSGTDRVGIVNQPGQRLTVKGPGGMVNQKPEWLQPPAMSDIVMQLVQFWLNRIENISGLSALQKGMAPNQRNASEVINNVQEAAFVRIRAAIQNLEDTLRNCGVKLADLIVDNYDEQRIMAIIGPDGETTSRVLSARHFHVPTEKGAAPLKYALRVQAGSTTPTSRQTRLAEALQMQALGIVDDQYVLEVAQVPHHKELLKRVYEKRQSGLMAIPGQRQRSGRSG